MNLRYQVVLALIFCQQSISPSRCVQAASITNVVTACSVENGTAVFPWSLTLDPGQTLNGIEWSSVAQTVTLLLEVDGSGTQTPYNNRASTNGSAFLLLENITPADAGTYRCTVRIAGSPDRPEDEAVLGLAKPPDSAGVNAVTAVEETSTSSTVEWKEILVNETCDEVLTYRIEYQLGSSGSWESAGSISGSDYGNTTLNYTVTGLNTAGMYTFGVRAENSLGTSSRVESNTVLISGIPGQTTTSTSTTTISPGGLSTGAIIGIVVGSIAGVALVAVIIWLIIHFNGKKQSSKDLHGQGEGPGKDNDDPHQLHMK